MFEGLGFISGGDYLDVNRVYTFTFQASKYFIWEPSDQSVMDDIQSRFLEGTVLSVNRGFASGRYAVSVVLFTRNTMNYWVDEFNAIFDDMGMSSSFVSIDAGPESSNPGGVSQVASGAVDAVGKGVNKVVTVAGGVAKNAAGQVTDLVFGPMLPVLLIGGGLIAGYFYMQSDIKKTARDIAHSL